MLMTRSSSIHRAAADMALRPNSGRCVKVHDNQTGGVKQKMRHTRTKLACLAGILAAGLAVATTAQAEDPYKIGISAGLTGYAATVDRAWSDGVQTAVDFVNANGGVLGRQLAVTVEDNRSEPQDAVTVYRKMI